MGWEYLTLVGIILKGVIDTNLRICLHIQSNQNEECLNQKTPECERTVIENRQINDSLGILGIFQQ